MREGAAAAGGITSATGRLRHAADDARDPLQRLAGVVRRPEMLRTPPGDVGDWLRGLASDPITPMRVVTWRSAEQALLDLAGQALIRDLQSTGGAPGGRPERFLDAWRRSCLELMYAEHPALAAFDGRAHDQFVEDFRRFDRQRIDLAAQRVRAERRGTRIVARLEAAIQRARE